jgi:hypothetical protein
MFLIRFLTILRQTGSLHIDDELREGSFHPTGSASLYPLRVLTSAKGKHYSSWVLSRRKARPGSNLCNPLQRRDEEFGGERPPSSVCADLREH